MTLDCPAYEIDASLHDGAIKLLGTGLTFVKYKCFISDCFSGNIVRLKISDHNFMCSDFLIYKAHAHSFPLTADTLQYY